MECTYWLDGWPTWLGGSGDEWLHCCRAHDLSGINPQTAFDLGACVSHTSPTMAALMMAGLLVFGPAYKLLLHYFTR